MMATRSKKGIDSANSIQLSKGKQLAIPSWMTVHHLPKYGISAASARSANDASAAPALTDNTAAGHAKEVDGARSNYKSQREAAMDSKNPPTTQEINSHIRYLSERAIHLVMQEVDDCVDYCLRYSSTPADNKNNERKGLDTSERVQERGGDDLMLLATEVLNIFEKFQPHEEEEDGDEDTSMMASVQKEGSTEMQEAQTETETATQRRNILRNFLKDMLTPRYDPTLLPIITIKCYPNVLDRGVMTNGLLRDLSKKSHTSNPKSAAKDGTQQMHPCVCIVRSTSELMKKGHILNEVLFQCISNDPNGKAFSSELKRQHKRQKSQHHGGVNDGILFKSIWSWTRSLVDWAGFTEAFDSIVVILEDPENIPSPTLGTFFTSLASLRNEGVPISAIVIDVNPGGLGDRLSKLRDPSLRSTTGVMMHELFVPLPQVQLDIFVNRLYAGTCLPTFFWTNNHILKDIQQLFQDCDNSLVSVAKRLKTELRYHFAKPAAITSMLSCENFTGPNEARLRWIFGNEDCRKQMLSHSNFARSLMVGERRDGHIHGLFWNWQTSYLSHQIYQRVYAIFNMSALEDIGGQRASTDRYSRARMRELLLLLGNVKDKAAISREFDHASWSSPFWKKLNEYIILAGKFGLDESSNAYDFPMARALVENILEWAGRQFTMQERLRGTSPVQPRRDVAKVLCLPAPVDLSHNTLSHASRIAFKVFQSKVMTLADWHEKYFDIVEGEDGQEVGAPANEAAFYFAVYSLVHCGFVKELMTSRRKEQAYEKLAIVWGSGR